MIGFLYVTINRISWPRLGASSDERKNRYLRSMYCGLHRRYGAIVARVASNKACEALSYAVMIYESFNRPRVYQLIENRILFPLGMARTLGPMQVSTTRRLPEDELVQLGVERINDVLGVAFARTCEESPGAMTIRRRRKPSEGYEEPFAEDFDASNLRFEDIAPYSQDQIIRRAAATYNIRSDYPGEVAGIFAYIRDVFYPGLNPDSPSQHPKAAS